MTAFRLLAVCLAVAGLGVTAEPPTYRLERLNLNVVPPKSRINGPSLVRLPEWLRHKDRLSITVHGVKQVAEWYLYFAKHSGPKIYLAWTSDVELTAGTVWHRYTKPDKYAYKAVAKLKHLDSIEHISNKDLDMGSPAVLPDHTTGRFVLYIHSAHGCYSHSSVQKRFSQCSYALVSTDGLRFRPVDADEPPQALTGSYLKPFYIPHRDSLHGIINEANLYHAPKTEAILPKPGVPSDYMTWTWDTDALERGALEPMQKYASTLDGTINHVGVAFVTPDLLEVSFNVKATSSCYNKRRHRDGRIHISYLDISSPNTDNWTYLTDGNGDLFVRQLLTREDLWQDGGRLKFSFASDSNIVVTRVCSGVCRRYLVVAYGNKRRGEGRLALFRLHRISDEPDPCIENEHPPIYGEGPPSDTGDPPLLP